MDIYKTLKEIPEMSDVELKEKLVQTLTLIVNEKVNLIEGVRLVVWLASALEILEDDLFNSLRGFESETDDFPTGEVREKWNKEALNKLDKEMEEYANRVKLDIIVSCKEILKKYNQLYAQEQRS